MTFCPFFNIFRTFSPFSRRVAGGTKMSAQLGG
jgi:hypothetical protein